MGVVVKRGEHAGKTLPEILFTDPDWFFDALENGKFQRYQEELVEEARDLAKKARNIKIREENPDDWIVEYYREGGFTRFNIVEADRAPHRGQSVVRYSKNIDMSMLRSVKKYGKLG